MRHPETRLKAYQNGDRLDEMSQLADLSFKFGEMFKLQAVYAEKVRYDCSQFLAARKKAA